MDIVLIERCREHYDVDVYISESKGATSICVKGYELQGGCICVF